MEPTDTQFIGAISLFERNLNDMWHKEFVRKLPEAWLYQSHGANAIDTTRKHVYIPRRGGSAIEVDGADFRHAVFSIVSFPSVDADEWPEKKADVLKQHRYVLDAFERETLKCIITLADHFNAIGPEYTQMFSTEVLGHIDLEKIKISMHLFPIFVKVSEIDGRMGFECSLCVSIYAPI